MGQRFKALSMERPRAAVVVPKGTLALMLSLLPQPSYGLLIAIAFKARSYDMAFPLLLAAARRRGDIHVIDVRRDVRPVALTSQTSHYDSKYRLLAEGSAIA